MRLQWRHLCAFEAQDDEPVRMDESGWKTCGGIHNKSVSEYACSHLTLLLPTINTINHYPQQLQKQLC